MIAGLNLHHQQHLNKCNLWTRQKSPVRRPLPRAPLKIRLMATILVLVAVMIPSWRVLLTRAFTSKPARAAVAILRLNQNASYRRHRCSSAIGAPSATPRPATSTSTCGGRTRRRASSAACAGTGPAPMPSWTGRRFYRRKKNWLEFRHEKRLEIPFLF